MKDDRLNIAYIAECIQKIQLYTHEGKSTFWQDSLNPRWDSPQF